MAGAPEIMIRPSEEIIMDDHQSNVKNDIKGMGSLTCQDTTNIQRKISMVQNGVKKRNDARGVELLVKGCERSNENPVLFYKGQGKVTDDFQENDFCLVMMSKYQEHMLTTYGPNTICVDSTRSVDSFAFTILMVADNYGEVFPVAFMFTNRKDTLVLEKFFMCVKSRVGTVSCRIFLSDVRPIVYRAWVKVMCDVQYYLFCPWHVDCAWISGLSKINKKEKQEWVYSTVKMLQENLEYESEEIFQGNLMSVILLLLQDSETQKFGEYFEHHYVKNYKQWAYFFRKDCLNISKMFQESMLEVRSYLHTYRPRKRLDSRLHAILKYMHDKVVERMVKNSEGNQMELISDIQKCHGLAASAVFSIREYGKKRLVQSDTGKYTVEEKLQASCCSIKCDICDICLHQYSCTCIDFVVKSFMCTHIHFVVSKALLKQNSCTVVDDSQLCPNVLKKDFSVYSTENKDRITGALADLQKTMNSCIEIEKMDPEMADEICSLLKNADNLLKLSKETENLTKIGTQNAPNHNLDELQSCPNKRKCAAVDFKKKKLQLVENSKCVVIFKSKDNVGNESVLF